MYQVGKYGAEGSWRVLASVRCDIIEAQEADGYIGTFAPDKRIKTIWDVHEMGYIIWALLEDHRYFGETPSLAAARKGADYLLKNWSALPPDWGRDADVAPHVAFTGIERTMLALHREWKAGDEVLLEMPMDWRLVRGRQRQAGRVAVMRGPQVFCLDPAQNPALAQLDGTELGYLAIN